MDPLKTTTTFDLRLQLPNHALFVGASMSGKTTLALRLLYNIHRLHPMPKTIIFYYDQYQDSYLRLQQFLASKDIEMELRQGCKLSLDEIEKRDHQTLIIIDDATEETASSPDIAKITTNGRHKNVSLWLLWHSLYSKHPSSRLITQNVGYIFLLPSVRLISQIHSLDTQMRMKGRLVAAYQHATDMSDRDERYLLLDLTVTTPNAYRIRSSITKDVQAVYL